MLTGILTNGIFDFLTDPIIDLVCGAMVAIAVLIILGIGLIVLLIGHPFIGLIIMFIGVIIGLYYFVFDSDLSLAILPALTLIGGKKKWSFNYSKIKS